MTYTLSSLWLKHDIIAMDRKTYLIDMILSHEGGYVNDSDDAGGMTYRGISRPNNPEWAGWTVIEEHLPLKRGAIIDDPELDALVLDFYDEKFYSRLRLDEFHDLMIAAHLMCQGVHSGRKPAVRLLQQSINAVNGSPLVDEDGIIGDETIRNANALSEEDPDALASEFIARRQEFYQDIVDRKPSQQKFLKGWLNRVDNTTACAQEQRGIL